MPFSSNRFLILLRNFLPTSHCFRGMVFTTTRMTNWDSPNPSTPKMCKGSRIALFQGSSTASSLRIPRTLIPEVASHVVMFLNISGMEVLAINSTLQMSKSKVQDFVFKSRHLAFIECWSLFAFFCFADDLF